MQPTSALCRANTRALFQPIRAFQTREQGTDEQQPREVPAQARLCFAAIDRVILAMRERVEEYRRQRTQAPATSEQRGRVGSQRIRREDETRANQKDGRKTETIAG